MAFTKRDALIPIEAGQAVNRGWTAATNFRPLGITWHWTVTKTLKVCRDVLGGARAERKGQASAHFGIGRNFDEGIDRYVSIQNRSWHAGINQTLMWNGRALIDGSLKGTRTTIGIETVTMGFARAAGPPPAGWINAADTNGKHVMLVEPWTDEQVIMMIAVGREIVTEFPNIAFRDHHGHHDICPGYKQDVAGFPFARVLRGIYESVDIPDVWTPLWMPAQRQTALIKLGYLPEDGADGQWGKFSDAALRKFQREQGMLENGMWTTFVNWKVYDAMSRRGLLSFFP